MTGLLASYPGSVHTLTIQHNEVKDGGSEHLGNHIATTPECKVQFMYHDYWSVGDKTTSLKVVRCTELSFGSVVLMSSLLLRNSVLTNLDIQGVVIDAQCKEKICNCIFSEWDSHLLR